MNKRPADQDDKTMQPVVKPESTPAAPSKEFGGQKGPEPTRYGDWENKGRCTDF